MIYKGGKRYGWAVLLMPHWIRKFCRCTIDLSWSRGCSWQITWINLCSFRTAALWMFQIQPRKIMCTYHFAHIFISFLFCFSLILIFSESELFFQMSIKEKSWNLSLGEEDETFWNGGFSFVYKGETFFKCLYEVYAY